MATPGDTPNQIPVNSPVSEPGWPLYAGLFLITCSTLLLELGLTRIFSVIIYYHMAFFAVSVTLFGLALGGVIVHFLPRVFTPERTRPWMAAMALAFAISTVYAIVTLLAINFDVARNSILARQLVKVSAVLAIPFTCSGIAVSLALTRFPRRTNWLYGFDLAGSALGCLLFAPLIAPLGGPRFVLAISFLASVAAVFLALGDLRNRIGKIGIFLSVAVCAALAILLVRSDRIESFKIRYARGYPFSTEYLSFDAWNAISRITVYPISGKAGGVSVANFEKSTVDEQIMLIDTLAATPITKFDGHSFSELYFPFHDISYAVHSVRKNARVAVIGVGGGRDVLAAKAWGQPEVVGIEINSRVIEAMSETFKDFAGDPLHWPGVSLVKDEARSYIARSGQKFDIIQASLIDTFAATSAGAFVLSENSLYTIQGWKVFLEHLSDDGILTMTRWYQPGVPVEAIRLLSLARATLEVEGVKRPQDHMLMSRMAEKNQPKSQPLATLLVKKTPFTPEEVQAFEKWNEENGFLTLLTPDRVTDAELAGVVQAPDIWRYSKNHRYDISPPTDNSPFFFDVLRWRDIFHEQFRAKDDYIHAINFKPLVMLGTCLLTVSGMAFLFIVIPFWIEGLRHRQEAVLLGWRRRAALASYFALLGLGYLMIELSIMQRFTVFLGHPTYSLTVCLFTMLLASGLGSMFAPAFFGSKNPSQAPHQLFRLNLSLAIILLVTLAIALWVMHGFIASPTPIRILLAGALLAPAAFLMGMPFPLALQAAAHHPQAPLSWYWGINGAFSVAASVLAVALAHSIGLNGAFIFGAICYFLASLAGLAFGPSSPRPSI